MNRTTALTAAGLLLVALPLAACTSSKPAEPAQQGQPAGGATAAPTAAASSMAAPAKASKNYNLQFIQGVAGDEFYITMQCGMEAEAAKLGVSVKTQGAQKFDPTLQKPILDSVAAGKPDAILIAPTDVTAMQAPLNAAAEAGTKIVLVDTTVEDPSIAVSAIASDNEGGGRAAFEAIKQLNPNGGKVMVMSVNPGISTTDARAKGFEDAVKEDSKFQYLGVQYSKNEPAIAANLIGSALQKDPDLVGVFAANLFSAEGTATGVRQAGKQEQVKIVSFDAGPNQVKALKEGTVQALVAQQPALIGQYGVDAAVTALDGGQAHAQGPNRLRDHHQGQCRRRGSCRRSTSPAADVDRWGSTTTRRPPPQPGSDPWAPKMDRSLSGKVAVVTGASSGIGLATARALADAGALLVIAARSAERLEQAARDLGGAATAIATDVTSTKEVDDLIAKTIELHGRIDILIANAGIYAGGDFVANDVTQLLRLIDTNVGGVVRAIHATLKYMIAAGTGDIVVTSSVSGHQSIHWEPVYSASKHAVQALTHGLRRQLIGTGRPNRRSCARRRAERSMAGH